MPAGLPGGGGTGKGGGGSAAALEGAVGGQAAVQTWPRGFGSVTNAGNGGARSCPISGQLIVSCFSGWLAGLTPEPARTSPRPFAAAVWEGGVLATLPGTS